MDFKVPVTHTTIHCKLKLCKTKVYLTHRPNKIRIGNPYAEVLEAASDSGFMVHAIFLTINSVCLIFRIVFCTHKIEKRTRDFPGKIQVGRLGGNHDGSKYHRSTKDNHDISKLIIPAFASTFQF